jgi:hypothetical protein
VDVTERGEQSSLLYYSKNMTLKLVVQASGANPIKLFMVVIYAFFVISWSACP